MMRLKKINAVLALLSVLTLLIHMGYNIFSYITLYYNPVLSRLTALPFMTVVCLHAVCGMCSVFLLGDGTSVNIYPKQNKGTVIQRVSAAFIFPLLIIHINTFSLLEKISSGGRPWQFILIAVIQVLFFSVLASHIAVSVSRAFVTLGLLSNMKKKKTMDTVVCILCAVLTVIAAASVIRGEIIMFFPG